MVMYSRTLMKSIASKALLVLYLIILIWVVFFKLRLSLTSVFEGNQRSVNFVQFGAPAIINGETSYGEMVLNCLFFIPFGLLLSVNFKRVRFLAQFLFIVVFSLAVELIQYIFAMGATDVTDLIANAAGGLAGLLLYSFCERFISEK